MNRQHKGKVNRHHKVVDLSANIHYDQFLNDSFRDHQYIREHNSLINHSHLDHDGVLPKNHSDQTDHRNLDLKVFRSGHNIHPDETKHLQLRHLEMPSFTPPSGYSWIINEDDYFILCKSIKRKLVDTGIHVCPHFTGIFSIVINEREIFYVTTLRQAINIAQRIGNILRDVLPIRSNYNKRGIMRQPDKH